MKFNTDVQRLVKQLKSAQRKFQGLIQDQTWLEDARKYAEKQKQDVSKLLKTDLTKVKSFIEREAKQLEKFQHKIPSEIKRMKGYMKSQRKEFEKILGKVKKAAKKSRNSKKKNAETAGSQA